ncbi:MAG: glutathione peroxidase [Veillonella sp.]|uniref:glutathione peroxidase n=1 Tax=Veillonella sp. TaxID=1926307 RepID=UPI0025D00773|nr:glutathione peroxidase [Veillonella sp.]MBE6079551.1 glutathione peroxidase [Veillonella sp.]
MSVYDYSVLDKAGKEVSLKEFEGQVLVIANTASKCGFTPQYEGLQALYESYKAQGFSVIAVPSNEFAEEEPGTNEEVQSFCKLNYGVTFPVMGKSVVRGKGEIPLFTYLTSQQVFKGFTGEKAEMLNAYLNENHPEFMGDVSVKWNFTKFLINRKGEVIGRFEPTVEPSAMTEAIEKALDEK